MCLVLRRMWNLRDWRTVTHAFQRYYILDAFAGVHYVNNAEILAMLSRNELPHREEQVSTPPVLYFPESVWLPPTV